MARIVSGADFGLRFPDSGGVANNNLANQIGMQLIGRALDEQRQDQLLLQQQQAAAARDANQQVIAQAEQIRNSNGNFEQKRADFIKLAIAEGNRGADTADFLETLDSATTLDELNTGITRFALGRKSADQLIKEGEMRMQAQLNSAGLNKLQFGGQELFKDSKNNLFFGTTRRNPGSGQVEPVLTPVGHSEKPEGALSLTNSIGLTPEQKVEHQKLIEENKSEIAIDEAGQRKTAELEAELELKPEITRQTKIAAGSIDAANEAIDTLGKVNSNINNLKQVVELVEVEGAETGPISDLFPSFTSATLELENLQKELGLDVVGVTTFGALSKGELDLALSKALPTKLDGPDLVNWAKAKIAAQTKVANLLRDKAIFLSQGGTQAEWLQELESRSASTEQIGRFQVRVR